jgi:hypothetical protein
MKKMARSEAGIRNAKCIIIIYIGAEKLIIPDIRKLRRWYVA